MTAQKGNKVYTIDETQKLQYQLQGFDIYNDNDELVEYGKGKTVSYEDYNKLEKENEVLQNKLKDDKSKK